MNKIILVVLGSLFTMNLIAGAPRFSKGDLVQQTLDGITDTAVIEERWAELFDHKNLSSDLNKERSNWQDAFPILQDRTHEISGSRIYYKLFKKDYGYTIKESASNNQLIVDLKIHYYVSEAYLKYARKLHEKNDEYKEHYPQTAEEILERVKKELARAEDVWNSDAPKNVRFRFRMTPNEKEAHYSIKLKNSLGALYDKSMWALDTYDTIAHEIGHMLGLDEEYSFFTSNVFTLHQNMEFFNKKKTPESRNSAVLKDARCNLKSVMCSHGTTVYPYHYNHILGRLNLKD